MLCCYHFKKYFFLTLLPRRTFSLSLCHFIKPLIIEIFILKKFVFITCRSDVVFEGASSVFSAVVSFAFESRGRLERLKTVIEPKQILVLPLLSRNDCQPPHPPWAPSYHRVGNRKCFMVLYLASPGPLSWIRHWLQRRYSYVVLQE